jgi:poly [ADP-ribose] polymerase
LHIERPGEAEQIEKWSQDNRDKAGHRRLLWHGSPKANFFGILNQGLWCPASGLYQADLSGMSAAYCRSVNSDGFMLLNEVELGRDFIDSEQDQSLPLGYGMGTTPSTSCATFISGGGTRLEWRDASHVHPDMKKIKIPDFRQGTMGHASPNQYVVYNAAQVRQRYLFHIKFS